MSAAADTMRQAGIQVISVAVGGAANPNATDFLERVGGNLPGSVITAETFTGLTGIIDDVSKSACTDVDLSVSCVSGFVGGQLSLQANLTNTAAFDVQPPIKFNVTLTNGLTNLTVVSSPNGLPATCVPQDTSMSRYVCTAGTSASGALKTGTSWQYSFTSTPTRDGQSSSTVTYIPTGPDNNYGNNAATCRVNILPGMQYCIT